MGQRYGRAVVVTAAMLIAGFCAFAQPTPGQAAQTARAKALPFLSPSFGDNMVLQRGKADAIWGWAEPQNVLVGDVWLCGGQSSMGLPLRFTKNADEEIKAANHPEIRFFTVNGHPAYHHVDVIDGNWQAVSPETASWIVSSPSVPRPTQVRYAWQSNPEATLFNGAGLPAAPFRTDAWPGKTEGVRPY